MRRAATPGRSRHQPGPFPQARRTCCHRLCACVARQIYYFELAATERNVPAQRNATCDCLSDRLSVFLSAGDGEFELGTPPPLTNLPWEGVPPQQLSFSPSPALRLSPRAQPEAPNSGGSRLAESVRRSLQAVPQPEPNPVAALRRHQSKFNELVMRGTPGPAQPSMVSGSLAHTHMTNPPHLIRPSGAEALATELLVRHPRKQPRRYHDRAQRPPCPLTMSRGAVGGRTWSCGGPCITGRRRACPSRRVAHSPARSAPRRGAAPVPTAGKSWRAGGGSSAAAHGNLGLTQRTRWRGGVAGWLAGWLAGSEGGSSCASQGSPRCAHSGCAAAGGSRRRRRACSSPMRWVCTAVSGQLPYALHPFHLHGKPLPTNPRRISRLTQGSPHACAWYGMCI
eukprot:COSAG01_NODE_5453_length_4256_cov_3.218186_3_plen_396_part_00